MLNPYTCFEIATIFYSETNVYDIPSAMYFNHFSIFLLNDYFHNLNFSFVSYFFINRIDYFYLTVIKISLLILTSGSMEPSKRLS